MRQYYFSLVFVAILLVIFFFIVSRSDSSAIYTEMRQPRTFNYASPVLISPSAVRVLPRNEGERSPTIYSPGRSSVVGSVIHQVPVGNFLRREPSIRRQSSPPTYPGYVFEPRGRTFLSKGEEACCEIFENFIGREVQVNKKYDFLVNSDGYLLSLDCYDPIKRVAIEYNGSQHYHFESRFQKTEEDFHRQQRNDREKEEICKRLGIRLIVVPYTVDSGRRGKDGKWRYVHVPLNKRKEKLKQYIEPFLHEYYST